MAELPFDAEDYASGGRPFHLRHMSGDQRAQVVTVVVHATNAVYPARDPELVLSAALGGPGPSSILERWVVKSRPDTLFREVRRIQAENWLYSEVVVNAATITGSVAPTAWPSAR